LAAEKIPGVCRERARPIDASARGRTGARDLEGITMRYMMLIRPDFANSPEGGPDEELMKAMGALLAEMTKAGVLLDTAGLGPLEESSTVRLSKGAMNVVDGPFTEAKEVVGGFALLQAGSREEAVEWTRRFLDIHGDQWTIDVEVRPVMEAS
jgi:hypothetical protein